MSAWPGKYVIGLTGNIATGKSEVRRMLERLGAHGIDADAVAHKAIARGEPAFNAAVEAFGASILNSAGEIDRPHLAGIVFSDPAALARLEAIVHPEVGKQIDSEVRTSSKKVIVIEAIKLLEAGYPSLCDSIWVTTASQAIQIERLMKTRGLDELQARQRILAQPVQEIKFSAADVIIHNNGSLEDTWQQVLTNWRNVVPDSVPPEPTMN